MTPSEGRLGNGDGRVAGKPEDKTMTTTLTMTRGRRIPGMHGLISVMALRWRDHREARSTRIALNGLDDHLMRDIGLTPAPRDPAVDLLNKARLTW